MDIHTQTAMEIFGVEEHQVTALQREHAKNMNFMKMYGSPVFPKDPYSMDKAASMYVTNHMGYAITLDPVSGNFQVIIDDESDPLKSATLYDLKERLEAYLKKVQHRSRNTLEPVTVAVLRRRDGREVGYECFTATILGINAREKYKRVLRAKADTGESIGIENSFHVRFLHPEDSRRDELAKLIKEQDVLQTQLTAIHQAILNIGESCTTIKLPPSYSKEDVMDNEPKLLEQLRAIEPMKEGQ